MQPTPPSPVQPQAELQQPQAELQPSQEELRPTVLRRAVGAAFPHTIPVLTGYLVMGAAFGVLLASKGFGAGWALVMALCVYAGSGQFVAVGLMAAGFAPVAAFFVTVMVNARHIFYGISMLEPFKAQGRERYYMIFALTDETFALLCSAEPPPGVSVRWFRFFISVLNQCYWVCGCTIGALVGGALPINTLGIDFVMTALFVVIFLEQWREKRNRTPALIGLGVSIVCRLLFGPQWFILAAMAALVVLFSLLRRPLEKQMDKSGVEP